MRWFEGFRIGWRLAGGFAIVIVLMLALATVGVSRISAVTENVALILHDRYAQVAIAHDIENAVNQQGRALRTALIATDFAIVKAEVAKVVAADVQISKAVERLMVERRNDETGDTLKSLLSSRDSYREKQAILLKFVEEQNLDDGAEFLMRDMLPVQEVYLQAIDAFTKRQVDGMNEFGAQAQAMAEGAKALMIALACVATLIAAGVALSLTRSITMPISDAVKVAETVASGDLTTRIEVRRTDEAGTLLSALQRMNGGLTEIVRQVRLCSDTIATGSSQIAAGNSDLSQRTEEQASNLQRTSASMDQMSATVKQSAEAARAASDMAQRASEVATKGGTEVREVIVTMEEIAASSRRIAEITAVIDNMAFQTNILAINAAVEAATAGEKGRGFGVVAGEIRALAQQAGAAAKEIRDVIGESSEKVETGSRLVKNAGATMDDIVREVRQVSQLISEIDVATQEQTVGIGQIGNAVAQLDLVTQQNAALVEESAAAAESLNQQARRLAQVVNAFKLSPD